MVYKMSRYGKFLACPNFPACRHTLALPKSIGVPCPQCGAQLLERISRKGRKFYGCERYPECDFVSWDRPVNDKCPVCGSRMVLEARREGHALPRVRQRNLPPSRGGRGGGRMTNNHVTIVGAGLAGCEAAWQLARRGVTGAAHGHEAGEVLPRPPYARALRSWSAPIRSRPSS